MLIDLQINSHNQLYAAVTFNVIIGATMLPGTGAYKKVKKTVLLIVVNNIQLKRLEEIVFRNDPHSLFIVENTFNVLGSTFSKRKMY